MKTPLLPLVTFSFLVGITQAADPVDPLMGDWHGAVDLKEGGQREVAVQMIPYGSGAYEARILARLDRRAPTMYQLRGRLTAGGLLMVDAIPFDALRVVRAVEDGVVYPATLWSGTMDGGALEGSMAGATKGRFEFTSKPRRSPTLGLEPPQGAVVLLEGSHLDAWTQRDPRGQPAPWKLLDDGTMEVEGGDLVTREKFGSFRLHLEFRTPYMPQARGQGRGNSGVYLQGRYEVQVLDSYGLNGEDNECGGIYQIAKPRVNMCLPPLAWQTYDIVYHAPELGADGKKRANAQVTIVHNGVAIHENLVLPHVTGGALDDREGHPEGLMLQDHGNPVRYRNIWLEKMD